MNSAAGIPVTVVGAGIAGLTAAFRLERAGFAVTVLERSGADLIGGRMASVERDGFHVDLGAPLLAARYRRMLRLIADAGLADQVVPAADLIGVVRPGIVHRGRTGTLPRLLAGGLLRAIPIRDRIRLLADLRRFAPCLHPADMSGAARFDHHSLTEFARRRGYAPQSLARLLDPLTSTVSLSDPEETAAITPFLFLALLAGGRGYFTSATGSGFLPRGLASCLSIRYGTEVTCVREHGDEVHVHWTRPGAGEQVERSSAAVLAVPSTTVPPLYPQLAASQREFLAATRYANIVQVTFCLDRPTAERSVILHTTRVGSPAIASFLLQHNLSQARVAGGRGMITSYLRGPAAERAWDLDDGKIIDRVLAGMDRLQVLPEAARHAVAVHVDRIAPGVVARRPGEYQALARAIRQAEPGSRVQLASGEHFGNSATIASVSAGEAAARRIINRQLLGGPAPRDPPHASKRLYGQANQCRYDKES